MKRYDFIDQLEKALKYKYGNFELELILDEVEKLGMQPPIITVLKDSYNRQEGCMGFEVNEWENED